jgi:hypothetical protein
LIFIPEMSQFEEMAGVYREIIVISDDSEDEQEEMPHEEEEELQEQEVPYEEVQQQEVPYEEVPYEEVPYEEVPYEEVPYEEEAYDEEVQQEEVPHEEVQQEVQQEEVPHEEVQQEEEEEDEEEENENTFHTGPPGHTPAPSPLFIGHGPSQTKRRFDEVNELQCCICLTEEGLTHDNCVLFICSHYLCRPCYDRLNGSCSSSSPICPMCRGEIDPDESVIRRLKF